MNRSAVLHIPSSQYAYAQAEDVLTLRLRAAKGDLDRCTLFWGDRACCASPVVFSAADMELCCSDELYDFYEVTLSSCFRRVCYYFKLEKGEEWFYYYADAFHKELPDLVLEDGFVVEGRSEYYQYPYLLRSEVIRLPEWFSHAIVYNIFPDSFADGKRRLEGEEKVVLGPDGTVSKNRLGGTIRGIAENLDYISGLGFNCLYLNPVFTAGEYHKYDIVDYFHIDSCLGTDADFLALVDAVHERGMHIIIDGVFNHCSWRFPQFEDVVQKGRYSEYWDWFYELDFPVVRPESEQERPGYACFAYERKMPKLNTANPAVQQYFAQVGKYWIEKFHVDGWRLDVANEVDKTFWRTFRAAVRQANPDAVLIGEVWEDARVWLAGDMFDSVMNYDFRKHCREFFALGRIGADGFAFRMTDMLLRYPRQVSEGQLNLLDSHDVARFYSLCGEDYERWQLAFLYLCMAPGVPSVFYGDEKRLSGFREEQYRQRMPWEKDCSGTEEFVRKLLHIRKEWIAPGDDWKVLLADPADNLLVFERAGKYRIRVLLHPGEAPVGIGAFLKDGEVLLEKGCRDQRLEKNGFLVLRISW